MPVAAINRRLTITCLGLILSWLLVQQALLSHATEHLLHPADHACLLCLAADRTDQTPIPTSPAPSIDAPTLPVPSPPITACYGRLAGGFLPRAPPLISLQNVQ